MFTKTDSKEVFLEQAKAAREERAQEKRKDSAAVVIQSLIRGWLARRKFQQTVLSAFDKLLGEDDNLENIAAVDVYLVTNKFLLIWKQQRDQERFIKLCHYLVSSLNADQPKFSYIGVFLVKEYSISWINQVKQILYKCCIYLDELKLEIATEMKHTVILLHTLVAFTSINTWNILKSKNLESLKGGMIKLCENLMGHLFQKGYYLTLKCLLCRGLGRNKAIFKQVSLSAIITLALRPLISANFSDKFLSMFLIHIMSVPAVVFHLKNISYECVTQMINIKILSKTVNFLNSDQDMRIVFNTLEGNYALCLLANIIHLMFIELENGASSEIDLPHFVSVCTKIMENCGRYVSIKQSSLTHWHPVLGWFAQPSDPHLQASTDYIKEQLKYIWHPLVVKTLLGDPLTKIIDQDEVQQQLTEDRTTLENNILKAGRPGTGPVSTLKRAFFEQMAPASPKGIHWSEKKTAFQFHLNGDECNKIVLPICSLYQTALDTLTQLRLNILTNLCYQEEMLYNLWQFISLLGPNCGLKSFLDLLATNTKTASPEFQMLQLFCDCTTHYVTILDDMEMYEQQVPFKLSDYLRMSRLLNHFLYKAIMGNLFDVKTIQSNSLFTSMHTLLMVLYKRDCRRQYAPSGHWLMKDIKVSSFMTDLEKGKKTATLLLQRMPHVISHIERVKLFRRHVLNEKAVLGFTESACASPALTVITIHRNRIVEDGYRQLALLPAQSLKGVIRVKFVNEQGLNEAGIDQDGVFKEFLEETIKCVFNPSLNLFKVNYENRLYPSPTSYMQENHLQLFEFVGRMLGKAVFEGIVVDVPFASFFLSQVLGHTQKALYSAMDELPSLDQDLYKSLTFIKHYKGDVSELDLNFSVDEDCMGSVVTYELIPGGKAVQVTNENKIHYIHLMAHFRMHTRIKDQTAAFIRGFKSIINPDWLMLFSAPELQRLISGDNNPLSIWDLRRNTQYYGGFHDSHRVIWWLWEILEKDFTEEERGLFLKFVTSCSKPPLLGFAHLDPPFSIRCVEVGDDEDTGDTIGSVIRGFFTIRKKDPQNRLPTSSTCFNLLKLPNYQRKSTLREKLRYAITCNTGFELS